MNLQETENRRALELQATEINEGYNVSSGITELLDQASDYLDQARTTLDGKSKALLSYKVIELSIQAKEKMTMEVAEQGIENRKQNYSIVVNDENGQPVQGADLIYNQTDFDFIFGGGFGSFYAPFPYPTMKAEKEIGLVNFYDLIHWAAVSPEKGVYDFSEHDAAIDVWSKMGLKASLGLVWLGEGSIPEWAVDLDFSEYKQQLAEFIKKTVEHFKDKVQYINLVVEPDLQIPTGSRYLNVDYKPVFTRFSGTTNAGLPTEQMVDLIKTVFDAAREVNSDVLLGYSGTGSYIYYQLNPLVPNGLATPYATIKAVIDSGVQLDYMGVEIYNGTMGGVPLDLSTISDIIQTYHDLTGAPVILTENGGFSSMTEDYGLLEEAINVFWHSGFPQANQAEWDTSILKIAMGFPFVIGVQTMRQWPDVMPWEEDTIYTGCGAGSDYLTKDFKLKKLYYAAKDLLTSWKANGNGITDMGGKFEFKGLAGKYSITVSTPDGLQQSYEIDFNSDSQTKTVIFNRDAALDELRKLIADAQMNIHW
jgi:hypothetical protein